MSKTMFGSIVSGILFVVVLIAALSTFGINDNGYRTVVQLPNGTTFIKFSPGIYFDWFGTSTEYPDVMTYNFTGDVMNDSEGSENGVNVRYQDGGTGTIYGVARFTLPTTPNGMLELHRAFRTEAGVRSRLIQPVMNEGMNLTAGLMTSEEAYAEKRNEFIEWSNDQINLGKYLTNLVERALIVEPELLDATGTVVQQAVTRVQNIPVIRVNATTGNPERGSSPLLDYEVVVSGFQVTSFDFETATLAQINEKREANMAIITSQANAARANQERLQAIAEGERNVATAEYEQEVIKAEQVVVAQRNSEVAAIDAARQVEVNRQSYLAQVQDVRAAEQEALAIELRSTAEAGAKARILAADGALSQKLQTYENVMEIAFTQLARQKWTPEIVMGGSTGTSSGNGATEMIDLLTTQAARQLSLDMSLDTRSVGAANDSSFNQNIAAAQ
tara:strand:+ start:1618 stop:2955 length:1338 start_codon:yes stop_codon:yes gene_type:complete